MPICLNPECGQENRPGARFCDRCGTPLVDEPIRPSGALVAGEMMRGGAYRILRPLGSGGMGAIYLASDTGAFDRRCVIKEMLDYFDPTNPEEVAKAHRRFEAEGMLLSMLKHPGIPQIYSYFSEKGRNYIVMEYVEGETLERGITHYDEHGKPVRAVPFPVERVVRYIIQVCEVLEYLLSQGTPIVHKDIKPANLIVDKNSGRVRLVDFGTAQFRHAPPGEKPDVSKMSKPSVYGTEGYAPQEQYDGKAEPRSDVYALAATAYHLLTDDDPALHPFRFPKMHTLRGPLGKALSRALRWKVEERSSAAGLRHALESWALPGGVAEPFVFRSGEAAHTTEDLLALVDKYWAESIGYLYEGDFARWFRGRNRHDALASIAGVRAIENRDLALEVFMHKMDASLSRPSLEVGPLWVDFGVVDRNTTQTRPLLVRNVSRGYGMLVFKTDREWLGVEPAMVGCRPGEQVQVVISTRGAYMRWNGVQDGHITITGTNCDVDVHDVSVQAETSLRREIYLGLYSLVKWFISGG